MINDSKTKIQKLKELNHNHTRELVIALSSDLTEFPKESFLHPLSQNKFGETLEALKSQDSFSPLVNQWLQNLDQLLYLIELHEIFENNEQSDEEVTEEDFFDYWNQTSLCEGLESLLKEGHELLAASQKLRALQEEILLSFCVLHLNLSQENYGHLKHHTPLSYQINPDIGDTQTQLVIGPEFHLFEIPKNIEGLPFLTIDTFNPKDMILSLETGEKVFSSRGASPLKIASKDHSLHIINGIGSDFELMNWAKKVEQALNIIAQNSPHCYQFFCAFTDVIIAHSQTGVVSYSQQELPGISSINAVERDFIDLIDDLIHENGHHYLNQHLNIDELIIEDDEKIFYSPWRESLRPIRGLYHAYCTFAWAHQLFSDLSNSTDPELKEHQLKIATRLLEENLMLSHCEQQLDWAHKNNKITSRGNELRKEFQKSISDNAQTVRKMRLFLEKESPQSLEKIKQMNNHITSEVSKLEIASHWRA